MFPIECLDAKARRKRSRGITTTPDGVAGRRYTDPAKAFVMAYIGRFVSDGDAEWRALENGDVELRFPAGDVFLLADATITRIA